MIILKHASIPSAYFPPRKITDYFVNNGARSVEEFSSTPLEARCYKAKFEFPDVNVNTWEEIVEERDEQNYKSFTYSGRIVLKGPGEKARAQQILEHFGSKIIGIKNFTPQKPAETPQQ